jgi:hypothetical protein
LFEGRSARGKSELAERSFTRCAQIKPELADPFSGAVCQYLCCSCALTYDINQRSLRRSGEEDPMHRLRVLTQASVAVSLLCTPVLAQNEKLNIQVSDPANLPVSGLQITTKHPGSTETTDAAGKSLHGTTELAKSPRSWVLLFVRRRTRMGLAAWPRRGRSDHSSPSRNENLIGRNIEQLAAGDVGHEMAKGAAHVKNLHC